MFLISPALIRMWKIIGGTPPEFGVLWCIYCYKQGTAIKQKNNCDNKNSNYEDKKSRY